MTITFEEWDHVYDDKIITQIIADSYLSMDDVRVTTLLLKIPRIILPEETRHRVFSFSVDSSRARSNKTKAQEVWATPFVPQLPLAEHKGMQGYEFIDDKSFKECQTLWYLAMHDMQDYAKRMNALGWSHQYTNRLLEPFMYIDLLITGTDWDNYLTLRTDDTAQFEIQVSARQIQDLLDVSSSDTNHLNPGDFHLPFVWGTDEYDLPIFEQCLVSVARSARTSYIDPTDSTHSVQQNISLAKQLLANKHMSPWEMVVQNVAVDYRAFSGNLSGGVQLRKLVEHLEGDLERLKEWLVIYYSRSEAI